MAKWLHPLIETMIVHNCWKPHMSSYCLALDREGVFFCFLFDILCINSINRLWRLCVASIGKQRFPVKCSYLYIIILHAKQRLCTRPLQWWAGESDSEQVVGTESEFIEVLLSCPLSLKTRDTFGQSVTFFSLAALISSVSVCKHTVRCCCFWFHAWFVYIYNNNNNQNYRFVISRALDLLHT